MSLDSLKELLINTGSLFRKAAISWNESNPFRHSAVVAYYALISLPALLVIIIGLLGMIWEGEVVETRVINEVSQFMGETSGKAVKDMLQASRDDDKNIFLSILGIATLIYGSTGVFYHLQSSLNQIWKVSSPKGDGFVQVLKDRLLSFGFVLTLGFLLLISFVVNALLTALGDEVQSYFPDVLMVLFYALDILVSLGFVSLLFAMIFKFLPHARVQWRSVWLGAFLTSLLFLIGEVFLGYYFLKFQPESAYGAAGGVILILLWISYASLIMFYGAEITYQHAKIFGKDIELSESVL